MITALIVYGVGSLVAALFFGAVVRRMGGKN